MKRIILIGILLLAFLTLFAACGEEPAVLITFMDNKTSDYTVIYPLVSGASGSVKDAVNELKQLTKDNAGDPFTFSSDFVAEGTDLSVYDGAHEILIGATNRKESVEITSSLRENDYVICLKNGKLIIAGGSDEATAKAVRRFSAMYFAKEQTDLILEENYRYEHTESYPVTSLTVGGKPVYEYVILETKDTKQDATLLMSALRKATGYSLSVVEAAEGKPTISFTVTEGDASLTVSDGSISISGNATGRALAIKTLADAIEKKGGDVLLDSSFSLEGQKTLADLVVMSLNVYSTGYAENAVIARYPRLVKFLDTYKPTVLALQDVSPTWVTEIEKGRDSAAPLTEKYGFVGTGRNNNDTSVMNPILYDKALYTLKDSGTFWLSDTPEWESVGWDGRTRCICTWVILTEKTSGKDFAVMNTRLDPYGKNARVEAMELIVEKAEAFDLPVILCGDMQGMASTTSLKKATETIFFDSENVAKELGEVGFTQNYAFGTTINRFAKASDFILPSCGDFTVDSYTILKDKVDDLFVSNHYAVYVKLSLAEAEEK